MKPKCRELGTDTQDRELKDRIIKMLQVKDWKYSSCSKQRLWEIPTVFRGNVTAREAHKQGERVVRKRTGVSHPFVTPAVMSGCWRGLTNCAQWRWWMQVSAPDFLPTYSSVKICLFVILLWTHSWKLKTAIDEKLGQEDRWGWQR